MAEMGLFWEAETYYNVGMLVFNNRQVEVTIDPKGVMGRYDVNVSAQVSAMDTDPAFKPIDITIPSMKGVLQFVNDKVFSSTGMVGEPEDQMELPLSRESKMKITKQQLQQVIREEFGQLSRDNIESHLLAVAQSMARDGISYKGILMGLNDEFMDNFDGTGSDYADYEDFMKELAMNVGGGVRMENKMKITKS